ncbi:MAG TPA: vitamin K epoxide reductase family protein [Candidatus Baltobacteraceae bacterium]|nr:vitamin K epoxide reductase family protein [Candidatus Baltobacteraceae bacterium]
METKKLALKVISIVAVIISLYLTYVHYQPSALICPSSGLIDCEQVLGSVYSTVLGVPIAVGGIIWFLGTFFLADMKPGVVRNVWLILGIGGLVYSITAMNEIGKICIYCSSLDVMIVAVVALLLLK